MKSALIEHQEGSTVLYDVLDVSVHNSGAVIVSRAGGEGASFAPGFWTRADLLIEEGGSE